MRLMGPPEGKRKDGIGKAEEPERSAKSGMSAGCERQESLSYFC